MSQSHSHRIRIQNHDAVKRAVDATVFVLGVVAVLAMLISAPGCVPAEAIKHAREQHAINVGYTKAVDRTAMTTAIGEAGADAWAVQGYTLNGDRLPPETVGRLRARGELPEGYKP